MTRIVILSSDTEVFVVAMYFYHLLAANGLAELCLRGGVGNKTGFIPVHVIAVKHTHNRFTALLESVRDHPGEQVPER